MATIAERRRKLEKEAKRIQRKLQALREECQHPPEAVSFQITTNDSHRDPLEVRVQYTRYECAHCRKAWTETEEIRLP